jgi:hypothetical protein
MEGIEWNKRQKNKDLSNNLKEIKQWKAKPLLPPINLLLYSAKRQYKFAKAEF